ncbi:MAG: hypothetical protein Q9187_001257 [Circinaria calcarea]
MVGRYYKEQAADAIAARDEALAEVVRLTEEVAKLKRDHKEHKKTHRCQLTKAALKKTVAGGRAKRSEVKKVNYKV